MAVKKTQKESPAESKPELKFTRAQLTASRRYGAYRDFLNGNLNEGKSYSFDEVDALIDGFYKKGTGKR